jgi:hypothetical protein
VAATGKAKAAAAARDRQRDGDKPSVAERREARRPRGAARIWQDYSLSIVVGLVFLATFVAHTIAGWYQYAADQKSNGDQPTVWGESGYVVYWSEWTFQNWQSEFLEAFVLVVFTAIWIHKGSAESKDGQEEMQKTLERIERRLDVMEATEAKAR